MPNSKQISDKFNAQELSIFTFLNSQIPEMIWTGIGKNGKTFKLSMVTRKPTKSTSG